MTWLEFSPGSQWRFRHDQSSQRTRGHINQIFSGTDTIYFPEVTEKSGVILTGCSSSSWPHGGNKQITTSPSYTFRWDIRFLFRVSVPSHYCNHTHPHPDRSQSQVCCLHWTTFTINDDDDKTDTTSYNQVYQSRFIVLKNHSNIWLQLSNQI